MLNLRRQKQGFPQTDLDSAVFTQNDYLKHSDGIFSPEAPMLLVNHSWGQIIKDPEAVSVPKLSGMYYGEVKNVLEDDLQEGWSLLRICGEVQGEHGTPLRTGQIGPLSIL